MEFFTSIAIPPFSQKIDHTRRIFCLGSCFAENIVERLHKAKFQVASSPTGILFNPESIVHCISRLSGNHTICDKELRYANERWFSYDFHSSLSAADKEQTLQAMQQALESGAAALNAANVVIVTFGTAWVYRLKESGEVVANCHKQPQTLFSRELLTVEQIVCRWRELLTSTLKDKQVIFTVSPIRHLSDGLEQNSLSKSTLRVAIAQLTDEFSNAQYFPSFEIMMDELRDYRFYAEDMIHPSAIAIDYIWQRFAQAAFTKECSALIERIVKITQAASHRPFNPQAEAYLNFCQKQIDEIEKLCNAVPSLDFGEEKEIFTSHL